MYSSAFKMSEMKYLSENKCDSTIAIHLWQDKYYSFGRIMYILVARLSCIIIELKVSIVWFVIPYERVRSH